MPDALSITAQLLDVLEHAHARKLVHRDIKPSNVLLARTPPGPVAKLADFGLMRRFESSGFSLMSRTGQRRGTPSYMPPEQVEDSKRVGPAADLYAVAGTLFFMLTGTTPLEFSPGIDPILTILEGEPRRLRALCPAAGAHLDAVVARCLAKAPKERFASATELRAALLAAAP